jgi:hypothetical protein
MEADALAQSWGFKVREWLEGFRHGAAFNLGMERWDGDPAPPVELNDCSREIHEKHLKEFLERIHALEQEETRQPGN